MLAQRGAVHVSGDQGVGVDCFLDRNAADERRHFAGNFIESRNITCLPVSLTPAFSRTTFRLGPENFALPTAPLPH